MITIRRALLSVSDKTGLISFAQGLAERGVTLLSTGGTAKAIRDAGLEVTDVSEVTGQPEILDGRVKTLHPAIHAGLLARRQLPEHMRALENQSFEPIDLLAVNLYPFEQTVAKGADFETCVENIDIGGPAMIRAASKNHADVAVVVEPSDYPIILQAMDEDGGVSFDQSLALARKAFARTAAYDSAISMWMASEAGEMLPPVLTLSAKCSTKLRYGENPHQQAALYVTADNRPGVATAKQHQGKALSYNNIQDADAAFELAADLDRPGIAIIKHANPCGVACAATLSQAYSDALACDPVSAFGGIIASNTILDTETAAKIIELFAEVIIAPDIAPDALDLFKTKANMRVLTTGGLPDGETAAMQVKSVAGGLLLQDLDRFQAADDDLRCVTKRQPGSDEMASMDFAWKVAKHVKSNAIVFAAGTRTIGVGAGQMSRVDSVAIAAKKAKELGASEPWVMASDAFFPFPDGIEQAADAGVRAVIQPGGSVRDDQIITAADNAGMAMLFTGHRHFRH